VKHTTDTLTKDGTISQVIMQSTRAPCSKCEIVVNNRTSLEHETSLSSLLHLQRTFERHAIVCEHKAAQRSQLHCGNAILAVSFSLSSHWRITHALRKGSITTFKFATCQDALYFKRWLRIHKDLNPGGEMLACLNLGHPQTNRSTKKG
jgi:hypothetical protein